MANFPSSVSTNANLYIAVNGIQTTLAAPITNSDTTITLTSTTSFPTTGLVTIENNEVVSYTGISGANLTGCTRGADGTTALAHSTGVTVGLTIVAAHHNLLKDEIIAIETALGASFAKGNLTAGSTKISVSGGTGAVIGSGTTVDIGVFNLGQLSNVVLTSPASNDLLQFNGTNWVNFPSSTNAVASTVMSRDANKNVQVNTLIENFTTTATAAGTTTLTAASSPLQQFTGTTTQNVVLPDATTLTVGYQISVLNRSTGSVTVKNNGGTALVTITGNAQTTFTVTDISTANGVWDASTSSGGSAVVQYVRYIVGTATGSYSGSTTVFDLPFAYQQDGKSLNVFYNGQLLSGSTYSETSSTQITTSTALVSGSEVVFKTISSGANATAVTFIREDYIVGTASGSYTGSSTVFNLTNTYTPGGNNLNAYLDGDLQTKGAGVDYVETSSSVVTFNNALVTGQKVSFLFAQSAAPAGTVSNGTAGQIAVYSSTGVVVSGSSTVDKGATPSSNQLNLKANGSGELGLLAYSADNEQIGFDSEWTGAADVARYTSAYKIVKNGDALLVTGNTGLTSGNSYSPTTIATFKPSGCSFNGTNTNDAAAAGKIGEVISASRLRSAELALTSATTSNLCSITLTAGHWNIQGVVGHDASSPGGPVYSIMGSAISVTSATVPASDTTAVPNSSGEVRTLVNFNAGTIQPNGDVVQGSLYSYVYLSASTTFYLVVRDTFTGSTAYGYGSIIATRVR